MKFQIIVPLSLTTEISTYAPYGAMYIATALQEEGHEVRIENGDIDKFDTAELLRRIKEFAPDVIGFSATVSTSYKYVKETSKRIRRQLPQVKIVVGGGLAAAAEVVLKHTETDIVVIGEGDVTIKELTRKLACKEPYHDVAGICFRGHEGIVRTPPRTPIRNLDVLKYPAFDLVDIDKYLIDIRRYIKGFLHYKNYDQRLFQPHRSKRMLRIPLSRGCINSCSFCYRPVRGIRYFSFQYIFDYIEYLMGKFNINVFSFGDECFAANKAWGWKFLEELRRRKLDIMFQILGTKVETVDYELLRTFKDAGCFIIEYGFESGSQKMLDIMEKRVTVRQNLEAARWTKQADLFTMPAFVFGMPGETTETVRDTIEFLKAIDYGSEWYQYTYTFAVPGTPLYEYAKATGLISDEDKYLESIYLSTPNNFLDLPHFINFTAEPLEVVQSWPALVHGALLRHYSKNWIDYFVKRYVKPKNILFSLKRYGFMKTLTKIWSRLFARISRKTSVAKQDCLRQESAGRVKHLEVINRFLGKDQPGMSLRKLLKQMQVKT